MPSVVGLLEQRELDARRRVDGLREEADRLQAELAIDVPEGAVTEAEVRASPSVVVKERSQVPVWREGWPGRHCRWTISASWPRSRIGSVSDKGR